MMDSYNQLAPLYTMLNEKLKGLDKEEAMDLILEAFGCLPYVRDTMKWKCALCLYHDLCYFDKDVKGEKEKA